MKKVAISQSNYIPWRGYFDLIGSVDEFILYDDMQYTKRDWRNRNKIKTNVGELWLSVPVRVKGRYDQPIMNTEIDGNSWQTKHFNTIVLNYKRATYFEEIITLIEPVYLKESFNLLSDLNYRLITLISNFLDFKTIITRSMDYNLVDGRTERLVDLCKQCGANHYVSGPAAKSYIDEQSFKSANVKLTWFSYLNYDSYQQLWGDYTPNISILDMLFNCGKETKNYLPSHIEYLKNKQKV